MKIDELSENAGTAVIRIVCAVVFVLFTFSYLYFYQADVLAASQHVLSGGATHYDRTIGAVLITLGLVIVQWAVYVSTRIRGLFHSLTYFPSALLLAVITSIVILPNGDFTWPKCWLAFPALLLVWGCVVFLTLKKTARPAKATSLPKTLWVNVMAVSAMCLFVGLASNGDDVFHYRMRAESRLLAGDYNGALSAGRLSLKTDRNLTMLRIYALARKGELGDKLFKYPVVGSSADMLPMLSGDGVHCVMYPADSIYRFLGARPLSTQTTASYLDALIRLRKAKSVVGDYKLCGYLIDRDLDGFVRTLPHYYSIGDSLPCHYREALTLYTHLRANPSVVYHNEVMDTDFEDLQSLERQYKDEKARQLAVFDQYGETYWWYYDFR